MHWWQTKTFSQIIREANHFLDSNRMMQTTCVIQSHGCSKKDKTQNTVPEAKKKNEFSLNAFMIAFLKSILWYWKSSQLFINCIFILNYIHLHKICVQTYFYLKKYIKINRHIIVICSQFTINICKNFLVLSWRIRNVINVLASFKGSVCIAIDHFKI